MFIVRWIPSKATIDASDGRVATLAIADYGGVGTDLHILTIPDADGSFVGDAHESGTGDLSSTRSSPTITSTS